MKVAGAYAHNSRGKSPAPGRRPLVIALLIVFFFSISSWNFFFRPDWLVVRSKLVPGPTNDLLIDNRRGFIGTLPKKYT